ncbi:hypothetical protein D3C72_1239590 [compost metagenome]
MKKPRPMPPWLGAIGAVTGGGAAALRPVLRGASEAAAIWAARARRALAWGRLVT